MWNALANCESDNRWDYNGPSGYDGGLQFLPSTWNMLNTGYAFAWQAPKSIQIDAATKLIKITSGAWGQWPVCSRQIGMPNKL